MDDERNALGSSDSLFPIPGCQPKPAIALDDSDPPQRIPAARPADANAGHPLETRAVHRADQAALIDQELAGRPIEPAPGVRADIQEGGRMRALAHEDQRFLDTSHQRLDFARTTVRNVSDSDQPRTAFGMI